MKLLFITLIIFFVLAAVSNAQEEEELIPDEVIEVKIPKEVIPDSLKENLIYDAIVTGGLGYSNSYFAYNSYSPTLSLGFELPFSVRHMSSFQLYSYIIAVKNITEEGSVKSVNDYNFIYGLSGLYKLYILKDNSDLRLSLHFGLSLLYFGYDYPIYPGLELGIAGYYRLGKTITLSLEGRYNFLLLALAYGIPMGPYITTLNVNYYLEW